MIDPGLPSPYGEPFSSLLSGLELNGQQQAFHEVLHHNDSRLANMYIGALVAVKQESNPDRIAQAAHSIRELLEKLPRYLDLAVPKDPTPLRMRTNILLMRWKAAANQPGGDFPNNCIPSEIVSLLNQFFDDFERDYPNRREVGRVILNELDPSGSPPPKVVQENRAKSWLDFRTYFEKICHHGFECGEEELMDEIANVEEFLLAYLRPRTLDNQAEILGLIREGEGNGNA